MGTPFELGFRFPSAGTNLTNQIRMANVAESEGFDVVYASETWGFDAFTRLGYLASATSEITLGTAIIPVQSRSPALIAQSAITLTELSDRPTVLGLGVSSPQVVANWHGMEFEPALRRQREAIEIIRAVCRGESVDYQGDVYSIEFANNRLPTPNHPIPIRVGAQGIRNIELVGGFADGWMPLYIPIDRVSEMRETLERGATLQDRSVEDVNILPSVIGCVSQDGAAARDRCRGTISFYIGAMGGYHANVLARNGYEDTVATVQDHWSAGEYELARNAVSDDLLDQISISGTPESVAPILEEYKSQFDGVIIVPPSRSPFEEIRETIRSVGRYLR